METQLLAEVVWIKWALVAIAACLVILTIAGASALWALSEVPDLLKARVSFADRAKRLLDQNKLEELLELCDRHINEYPADAYGYWFQGQADYRRGNWRRALASLRKVNELQPDWEAVHTKSMIELIEAKLSASGERSDLKLVAPAPSASSNPKHPDGTPDA